MRAVDLLPKGLITAALLGLVVAPPASGEESPSYQSRSPVDVWLLPVEDLGMCAIFMGPDHRFAGRKMAVWCFPFEVPKRYPMQRKQKSPRLNERSIRCTDC